MDKAVQMAPDRVGVRIPRGATLLTAARDLPNPARARPLIETAVSDYDHTLEMQQGLFRFSRRPSARRIVARVG